MSSIFKIGRLGKAFGYPLGFGHKCPIIILASMSKERFLVTSALPYANGPIHFGHIAGAYLPADIFVRFKKVCKEDVVYICGTDEHGFAITVSAQLEGNDPQKHVDHYHKVISGIFEKFNIEFDNFSRTSLEKHHKLSQQFFEQLLANQKISAQDTEQLYCNHDKMFLADRYVYGTCPHCGFEEARGDECGQCGKWLEALELKTPHCKMCNNTPVKKETRHWFLELNKFSDSLKEWLSQKEHWKPNVKNFINSMIEGGLEPRPITRDMNWGVKVPLKEAEGKVLYVWFDAPIGYISSTIEWAEKKGEPELWKKYWENPDCKLVHFIGKDNLPFHCVVWPSMLMGQNEPFILPHDVPANEFYNLEGKQFSKSTGWYIDLEDFFKKYSTDSIRYAIAANAPETKDSSFSWKDFQLKNNSELADIFGNFINRTLRFIGSKAGNTVPEFKASIGDTHVLELVSQKMAELTECYNNYQVRRACNVIMDIGRIGNKYFDEKAPWKSIKENLEECQNSLYVCTQIVKSLALACYPIIPESAQKIWQMLGLEGLIKDVDFNKECNIRINSGHVLGESQVLFGKIEDKQIETEIENLNAMLTAKTAASKKDAINLVTIDDVAKVQLKTGRVVAAEEVPKSKKLLKLEVDLGSETRQILAGIKESYSDPKALIGKLVIAVSNLKPAKLMGLESQGMLLAAKDSKGLKLITVDDPNCELGAEVR